MKEHCQVGKRSDPKLVRFRLGPQIRSLTYLGSVSLLVGAWRGVAWRGMWGLNFFFVCFRLTRAVHTVRNYSKACALSCSFTSPLRRASSRSSLLLIYLVVPLTDSLAAHHTTHNTYVFRTTAPSSSLSPPFPTKTPTPSFHFKGRKKK
jgi:hypothetical protein